MLFDPLARTIEAYDKLSAKYSEQWFESDVMLPFLEAFSSHLKEFPLVLDAGCGSGREVKYLTSRGIDCVGVDLSLQTIKRARMNVPSGNFRVMDLRRLEYPDSLFDGVLCVAVVHHLYDRDFRKALLQIGRVTRAGGIVGVTIRIGEGFRKDGFGRFMTFRNERDVEDALRSHGFTVLESSLSKEGEGREWLQLILRNDKPEDDPPIELCGFCPGDLFLKENRLVGAPVAAGVLWGDDKFYVTLDVSPLVEGHLLLCTREHTLATLGTQQNLNRLADHKAQIDDVLKRAFNRRPIFMEHGTQPSESTRDPCIEHAHIHALPLQNELRTRIEKRIGKLTPYRNIENADRAARMGEYISYESKRGVIFVRQEGVADLPSQFFRLVVADELDVENYHWIATKDSSDSKARFKRTLDLVIGVLDHEISSREIVSDIPQSLRQMLASLDDEKSGEPRPSKTAARMLERLEKDNSEKSSGTLTLSDLGERRIIEEVLTPFFDGNRRGQRYLGDDAAVFPWHSHNLLVTTDHCPKPLFFRLGIESYFAYGWLSAIISLSDIGAMGGRPRALLLNSEMPNDMPVKDFVSFVDGLAFASNLYDVRVIGGNIREAKEFSAATTVIGEPACEGPVLRDAAEIGHAVFAVGEMGLFWAAILERANNLLLPLENHHELNAGLLFPEPKLRAAHQLSEAGILGAAMDASDGPTQAIKTLAQANSCDIVLDLQDVEVNRSVELVAGHLDIDPLVLMFSWGNFELIFTAPEDAIYEMDPRTLSDFSITRIGYVKKGSGKAKLKKGRKTVELPQLAPDRFDLSSGVSGIAEYEAILRSTRFRD
ncbi:methyltransferase domain-containing protein [Erythrobacter sp. THAF29]|uniref:methyltransferase domain-containing protein n=1 Tax=Erythrobacter sp. THAF29 TaxID=2587851 RepID=UPI0012688B2B|nr:methyltransferase domain-containing protein [Erythrobacter sp. THAF29]